jgi:hypothetical protein
MPPVEGVNIESPNKRMKNKNIYRRHSIISKIHFFIKEAQKEIKTAVNFYINISHKTKKK